MLELDVHRTKDNVIVVAHDGHLSRVCGEKQFILHLNYVYMLYRELPKYLPTHTTHFCDSAVTFDDKIYSIIKLESVFESFPGHYVCVDIKDADEEMVRTTLELVRKYNRVNRTVILTQFVGSTSETWNRYIYTKYNDNMTFFSAPRCIQLFLMYFVGLAGFMKIYERILCIPLPTEVYSRLKKREIGYWKGTA